MIHDPNTGWAHTPRRPKNWPAGWLAIWGLAALVVCLVLAIWRGPADADITDGECQAALAVELDRLQQASEGAVGIDLANDARGELRIAAVAPDEIAIGGHLCAVVSGVIAEAEENEVTVSPIDLAVFFNGAKWPSTTVKAVATHLPQRLWFRLAAPENAEGDVAQFWRELARGVGMNPAQWGKQEVTLGLSVAASTAAVPDATSVDTFRLYVYSLPPVLAGFAALGLLTAAFCGYAARTTLLRDNDLTARDLEVALAQKRQALDAAETTLQQASGDATLKAARDAAKADLDAAEAALRQIPASTTLTKARDAAKVDLDAAELALQQALDNATLTAARDAAKTDLNSAETALQQAPGDPALTAARDATKADLDAAEAALQQAPDTATLTAARDAATNVLADSEAKLQQAATLAAAREAARTALDAAETALRQAPGDPQLTAVRDAAKAEVESAKNKLEQVEASGALPEDAVGTFSLGRTQMAFWMFLVATGYIYIALSIGQIFGIINGEILTLLGISSVTGLAAVQLTGADAKDSTSRGFFHDILSPSPNGPQLQRIQAVAWTLILGAIFVWIVFLNYRFPVFDPMLLLLTGLVSGTYLGFKRFE